jgi:hypothetical protein
MTLVDFLPLPYPCQRTELLELLELQIFHLLQRRSSRVARQPVGVEERWPYAAGLHERSTNRRRVASALRGAHRLRAWLCGGADPARQYSTALARPWPWHEAACLGASSAWEKRPTHGSKHCERHWAWSTGYPADRCRLRASCTATCGARMGRAWLAVSSVAAGPPARIS